MLTKEIKDSLQDIVLCWLATADADGSPNVSPKEAFLPSDDDALLIANIASPISVRNIQENPSVCVGVVNVFKQKGFKIRGRARNLTADDSGYEEKHGLLRQMIGDEYPIRSVIEVQVDEVSPIIAPSYWLFADTTEEEQSRKAMSTYGVKPA